MVKQHGFARAAEKERKMTRTRTPLVESFGPELLAALLKASTGRYTVHLPFNHAVRFRQRLYSLRNALRLAKHEKYSLVSRVRITLTWNPESPTRKAGDHTVPLNTSEPCEVELMPNDTEFSSALADAGVSLWLDDLSRERLTSGGLAAMIHDMLHQDISAFEVRDIPHTDALDDQKRHSLDSLDKWLLAVLERGFAWRSRYGVRVFSEWHEFVATELFNRSYQQWCDDNRIYRPMSREQLGRRLVDIYQRGRPGGGQIIGEVESATLGVGASELIMKKDRAPGYQLGSLDEARARFADQRGVTGDWKAEP